MRQFLVIGILIFLSKRGKVKAKEIAEEFEISTRTVYRYIDALCLAGVPVITIAGKNGGISVLPDFKLEGLCYTNEEREKIKQALKVM